MISAYSEADESEMIHASPRAELEVNMSGTSGKFQNSSLGLGDTARSRGFTIVELLITIAIIFILVTTAFVAFRNARKTANRTESLSALRQMMTGYIAYYSNHNGHLLPGYITPSMIGIGPNQVNISAKLPNGTTLTTEDTAGYVWRLAPYLDHSWKTYMVDYRSPDINSRFENEYNAGVYGPGSMTGGQYLIAAQPSFGMNSIYLGGDSFHANGLATSPWASLPNPNPNTIAAQRFAEVKNPSKQIVFAPTQHWIGPGIAPPPPDGPTGLDLGYVELCPPFASYDRNTGATTLPQWVVDTTSGSATEGKIIYSGNGPAGVPADRFGDSKLLIGYLDGNVGSEFIGALSSTQLMSRWSPFALSNQ